MAKRKRPPEDKAPSFPATPAYKQWVWEEMRRRGWTLQNLVDEMKRVDRSLSGGKITAKTKTAGIAGILGPEDAARRYQTNTELMPAMNKALEIAPPSICDPSSPLAQIKDRLDHLWRVMTDEQRELFLRSIESTLNLVEPK
jgi:alkylation response protein AidB-like acyl-CoA dehydrogenase